jgi:hypothetical protein
MAAARMQAGSWPNEYRRANAKTDARFKVTTLWANRPAQRVVRVAAHRTATAWPPAYVTLLVGVVVAVDPRRRLEHAAGLLEGARRVQRQLEHGSGVRSP